MARIVVSGYMVRHPLAGNLLAYFGYVLGLHRLGHEVVYLEESGWPDACYNPRTLTYGDDPGEGLRAVRALMAAYGLDTTVVYVNRENGQVEGAAWGDVKWMLRSADLLLNVGGVCWLPDFQLCRRRALIDMDPLFTQAGRFGGPVLDDYNVHFSYGVNIGRAGCTIPSTGVDWLPTVPPVMLEMWRGLVPQPHKGAPASEKFTTIASWDAYGAVAHGGECYGQKDREFLRVLDLPSRTAHQLEIALAGASPDVVDRFRSAGWSVRDPAEVSADVRAYQSYIVSSRGEFSVAKHAYVKSHSGWFSDRTVCYLAAGLPAVLQNTGFTDWLPAGRGVLPFSSAEEAVDCLDRVNCAYEEHAHAARLLAAEYFAAERVLPRLLQRAMA